MKIKNALKELAIFGGEPSFEKKLHVGCPNIGSQEHMFNRLHDILDRRWLTNNGPYVQELEQKLADFIGVKHCVATCNATVALEIAIRALGLSGEVIVPSFTFVATPHSLQWQEITPVFCDINANTHTVDAARVEELLTPRTSGIIGVHLWGRACDVEALSTIAKKRNLKLLFDAAHAFGCSSHGKMIGGFGDAEVFSFHATKFFNTFEGGAVMTNNDDLATRMRLMRNFGFGDVDQVIYIGTNGKMNEACAAMGLTNLESLSSFVCINRRNYELYSQLLLNLPGVRLLAYDTAEHCNFQYIVLEIDETVSGVSRDQIAAMLSAENVIARRYFYPGCHRMEPYRSYFPNSHLLLPNTERLCGQVMALPTGTAIGPNEIASICGLIRLAIANRDEFLNRLGTPRESTISKNAVVLSPAKEIRRSGRPKVSVLMLTYNHERYISEAIESVLKQAIGCDYELLIGDDYSTDSTYAIATSYQEKYPDKIFVHRTNCNCGMYRNFVNLLEQSRGDYIAFLEGDDFWLSEQKLQRQLNYLESNPDCSLCFHRVVIAQSDSALTKVTFPENGKGKLSLGDLCEENCVPTCSVVFRRSALKDVPTWCAETRILDWPLFLVIMENGNAGFVDEAMAAYRHHDQGAWSSLSELAKSKRTIETLSVARNHFANAEIRLRMDQRIAKVYRYLAWCHEKSGNIDDAMAMSGKALQYNPTARNIRHLLRLMFQHHVPSFRRVSKT